MKLNFDELENGMLSECAVFCEEEEKMESMLSFDWSSVSVNSGEVIALMRKHRNDKLDVLFHYASPCKGFSKNAAIRSTVLVLGAL